MDLSGMRKEWGGGGGGKGEGGERSRENVSEWGGS